MLHDYKGETPKNVITEEEHKKRPFYKKVSFWVLSALGLFFGGCSVYGLVLGYQYVQAVTQAAHIIADANSGEESDVKSFAKHALNAVGDDLDRVSCIDLGSLNWLRNATYGFYASAPSNIVPVSANTDIAKMFCDRYDASFSNQVWSYNNGYRIALNIPSGSVFPKGYLLVNDTEFYSYTAQEYKEAIAGTFLYYLNDGTGSNVYHTGYQEGHDVGYQDGYSDGYEGGYSDGSDAINLPQSVKVLLPEGNQYSVQYKSYVDGVVDRQGQLNSSQTGGAYATFDRSRTQKLRIDLTLPTGSRAFFLYTPSWTSAYPTDENYSLRQSWAVSGVTYLPTWVSKRQIHVGVTSADVPDLTYETVSVAFDVDHWGDIKVGAYSQGYNDGYQAGEENPTAYDSGYDAGYEQGYDDGHTLGVAQGESQAVSGQKALVNMFVTAFQQPFDQIYRFLNFNVLGLNILALFTALLTLSIGIIIIKKVI